MDKAVEAERREETVNKGLSKLRIADLMEKIDPKEMKRQMVMLIDICKTSFNKQDIWVSTPMMRMRQTVVYGGSKWDSTELNMRSLFMLSCCKKPKVQLAAEPVDATSLESIEIDVGRLEQIAKRHCFCCLKIVEEQADQLCELLYGGWLNNQGVGDAKEVREHLKGCQECIRKIDLEEAGWSK